ncbi:MAG TPA: class I SAM-dependent methyltransferase [Gammaproteobacteria bacterium]|nr:class I SAM-dependent methyltransferase [Gammaproteobacteria bacterium]
MKKSKINIVNEFHEDYFETRFVFDEKRDVVWKEVCDHIVRKYNIPTDSRILDLGAGYCNFINRIQAKEKYAVDIFSKMEKFADKDVISHISTCTNMPFFSDNSLDLIFTSNLFEHLTHEELLETLSEIRRILIPDGRLIILQPNFKYCYKTYFDDYTHLQIFTDMGMYDLLEMANFQIEDMVPRFLPVNMKSTLRYNLPKLGLLVKFYLHFPFKPLGGQFLAVARNNNSTTMD